MKLALTRMEKARAIAKFFEVSFHKRPVEVSIEVTRRCNARCDFCDFWKVTDRNELSDFTEVIRHFNPLVVVLTGGEPMLRRDLIPIVRSLHEVPGFRYLCLLTHGGFMNEDQVRALVDAGLHQINVSLNYPDSRQDRERGMPGLFSRLERTIPRMVAEGLEVFTLASMLMVDNMRDAEPLVRLAHSWGARISFSGYNDLKNGNRQHFVPEDQLAELGRICERLKQLKRELGNVATSDYFFDTLPSFYRTRDLPGCRAGRKHLHVSPLGWVQPCAELPPIAHFRDFTASDYPGTGCGRCFDACRAEPQAPLTVRRVAELAGLL